MNFEEIRKNIEQKKKILAELETLFDNLRKAKTKAEKKMTKKHIEELKKSLKENSKKFEESLKQINLPQSLREAALAKQKLKIEKTPLEIAEEKRREKEKERALLLEERTLKRLLRRKEKREREKKKVKKPSRYIKLANFLFGGISKKLAKKEAFEVLRRDLVKANLPYVPTAYMSLTFFTTLISFIIALGLFAFFLFFNFNATMPMITKAAEPPSARVFKVLWIVVIIPLATFLFTYFYPSLEKRALEYKIDNELPFATINMAAISGSMIDPTKIFEIMMETHDYPALEKQFTKLMNEINIYGYDLVTALRNVAYDSPSKKLTELFNGLATTISSGGNLPEFFRKRSESLLFEYQIEREKNTKAAETFMDIYISIVIAAPMILMLLMMMIKMGGLGISLSTGAITLITVLVVTTINIAFLAFLHLKQT